MQRETAKKGTDKDRKVPAAGGEDHARLGERAPAGLGDQLAAATRKMPADFLPDGRPDQGIAEPVEALDSDSG